MNLSALPLDPGSVAGPENERESVGVRTTQLGISHRNHLIVIKDGPERHRGALGEATDDGVPVVGLRVRDVVAEEKFGVGEAAGDGDGAEVEELGGDGGVVVVEAVGEDEGVDLPKLPEAVASLKETQYGFGFRLE
ncbi:hypothetical protein TIFTF001_000024 [Ficus carica]|uniref:Uncharacterized protein n=1 Tax=Ficus carica TaxID=3494 RepID=A0AA87ZEH0_FICCA|nr:hypothetical protein TIFTF001_000024 [Ficus carica]